MGLYKELDWWSMSDKLEEIIDGRLNRCFKNSEYADYYEELLTEMANMASGFWMEFDRLKDEILNSGIPYKTRKWGTEEDNTENAAFWINTVALTLTETDIELLFDREENYGDYEEEKRKRINLLKKLSKEDFMWLVSVVSNLLIKFLELDGAWEAIKGVINELDSRQAFVKDKDGLKAPKSSYL